VPFRPECLDVVGGRSVALVQLQLNLAVIDADPGSVGEG
jgi:hypothetical protein